jgi:diaminopimelate epimerase
MNQHISFIAEDVGIVKRGRPFVKMHGLRNDFIIVDGRRAPYRPASEEVIRICDRREGVGADELLIVNPPRTGPESAGTYAFVRILNPDGREVEACGNATRCVGWLFLQESQTEQVVVDTLG